MKRLAIILAGVFVLGTAAIADNQPGKCVTKLNGLTAKQIEKINQLEGQHQKAIGELQTERQSTANWMEKDKIRAKMLNQKEAHFQQVKEVLTAEQWSEFESLHQSAYGNRQGRFASNNSNGCRGNGNRQAGCGNRNLGRGKGNFGNAGTQTKGMRNNNGCFRTSQTSVN